MNTIGIVVLHYKNIEDTVFCVGSIHKQLATEDYILVVDNCSEDSISEVIKSKFANVDVISTPKNNGYAGGMNFGAKYLLEKGFDYILLTNNDVEFEKNFLEKIRPNDDEQEYGIISPKVLYFHDKSLIYCAGAQRKPAKVAVINRFRGMNDSLFGSTSQEINSAEGCTLLVNRKVFDAGYFFDEKYFMYFEDADFSFRVSKYFKIFYKHSARVYHKAGAGTAITNYSNLYHYYYTRNRLYFIRNFNVAFQIYGLLFSALVVLYKALAIALVPSKTAKFNSIRAMLNGYKDGFTALITN